MEENKKAGIIIAILILIIVNYQNIMNILPEPQPYFLDSCEGPSYFSIDIPEAEKDLVYIPDYDAEIEIKPFRENFNEYLEFSVIIENKSLQPFYKPYFHIWVFGPDDQLKGVLPCHFTAYDNKVDSLFKDGPGRHVDWIHIKNPKLIEWKNDGRCSKYEELNFVLGNSCVNRNVFLEGEYGNRPIVYRHKTEEPGKWKVYVFLFDEMYVNRETDQNVNNNAEGYQNPIAYDYREFEVTSSKHIVYPDINIISVMIAGVFALFGYFIFGIKAYDKLKKLYLKRKKEIINFLIISIIIVILTFLVCKFACPTI